MNITRRKFLRLAPIAAAAVTVGVVVLPKITPPKSVWAGHWRALGDTMFKAIDPPLMKAADPLLMGEWMPEPGGIVLSNDTLPDFYAGDWVNKLNKVKG